MTSDDHVQLSTLFVSAVLKVLCKWYKKDKKMPDDYVFPVKDWLLCSPNLKPL